MYYLPLYPLLAVLSCSCALTLSFISPPPCILTCSPYLVLHHLTHPPRHDNETRYSPYTHDEQENDQIPPRQPFHPAQPALIPHKRLDFRLALFACYFGAAAFRHFVQFGLFPSDD
jgi:hypothetical protein